ncbi:MAG: methyltransferase domain-containing protein [Pseudomonadota bacterium]
MTTQPPLTDSHALSLRRKRATAKGMVLQESAADEIKDRVGLVNRAFTQTAVVTPYRDVWATRFPGARIVADTDTLALEPHSCDLILHAMSLHWANDPVGQLIQCRRALKPDGLMIAATLGGQTLEELRRCLGQAEASITGGLSPRVAPMGEIRDYGALLQRAGFALPVADSLPLKAHYRDAFHLMRDLREMGETNVLSSRHRTPPPRSLFFETARLYGQAFANEDGGIFASFEMIFLTGWAPDPSQQQPLRPGSAKSRLADALKVPEHPLRD